MRSLANGQRQVFLFLMPGDLIGSFRPRSKADFYQTVALTGLETVDAAALADGDGAGGGAFVDVVRAGVRLEEHMQGLLFDQVVRLGARDAYCGLADLLLEFNARLTRVDLVDAEATFLLPIGQRVLAQVLGVSVVHLNQTLKRMVGDGLIEMHGARMRLLEPQRMAALLEGRAPGAESSGHGVEAQLCRRAGAMAQNVKHIKQSEDAF